MYLHRLVVTCLGAVMAAGLTGCGATTSSTDHDGGSSNLADGTLDVFTSADYPPFSYLDSDGTTVVGLESDLLAGIAEKLGVSVEYHVAPFDTMIPGISNGRADVAVMAMVDTPQRREQVDFIDLYKTSWRVLTQKGNAAGLDVGADPAAPDPLGLCGRKGVAVTGSQQDAIIASISEQCAADGRAPINASMFPDGTQENLSVKTGRAEFNLQQPANTAYILEQNPDLEALPGSFVTEGAGFTGWVFKKGNTEFQDQILGAMNEMIADGAWAQIFSEYGVTENDIVVPPMRNSERLEGS